MTQTSTDRIEKKIILRAPKSRVWRALTNAKEFGEWFRVKLEGEFAVGNTVKGKLTFPGYEHLPMEVTIVRMDKEELFSYRWHPYAIDPKVDYTKEPTTLVEFRLETVPEGTQLTVVESGFDRIPIGRRAEAYRMNTGGWAAQLESIARYVGQ